MPTPCPYILMQWTEQRAAAEGRGIYGHGIAIFGHGGVNNIGIYGSVNNIGIYGHCVAIFLFGLGGPNIPSLPLFFGQFGPLATTLASGLEI